MLAPLNANPDLVDQVYESLLESLCDGSWAPGEKLTQEAIAARLGVSRQPVLQALRMLAGQGLVVDSPNKKGVAAAGLDADFIEQLYEVRGALDALAARSAASGARPELREQGGALIRTGRAAAADGNLNALVKADLAFHRFIYGAGGNALLAQTAMLHWHHTRRVMAAYLRIPASFRKVWTEHQQILDAIVEGDARQAEKLSRLHALASVDFILSHWNADRTPRIVRQPA